MDTDYKLKKLNFRKIFPSHDLIRQILQGIPYRHYVFYQNIEDDILYDHEFYEPGNGLQLLDFKLCESELFTNYPTEWLDEYFGREFVDQDPVIQNSFHSLASYTWGRQKSHLPHIGSDLLDLSKILKQSANYGIESGISVPIRLGDKVNALFTVTFDPKLDILSSTSELYQLSYLLHNLGCYFVSYTYPTSARPLTKRQKLTIMKSFEALYMQSKYIANHFQRFF